MLRITRSGTQPSQRGPAEHFTGSVRIDPLFQPTAPARAAAAYVTFEPCARIVWTPPGVKHWHGAAPTTAMTHLALQEQLDGKGVDGMEKVTDDPYGRR